MTMKVKELIGQLKLDINRFYRYGTINPFYSSDVSDLVVETFGLIDELQKELSTQYAISYSKENEALLAKNKELEEELQERKAYIVANPCAQCGGRINAMKCDAWAKKAKELEEKVEMLRNFTIELEIELLSNCSGH